MTKIKLCGLKRPQDIQAANELLPAYIGFVFAPKSRRYVHPDRAEELRRMLNPGIIPVGVFVNETPETVAALLDRVMEGDLPNDRQALLSSVSQFVTES